MTIPLFSWALLVGVAAIPAIPAIFVDYKVADKRLRQSRGEHVASDDDADRFKLDEAVLKTNESDDPELSSVLVLLISKALPGTPVTVRVKSSADSVLILMKPGLTRVGVIVGLLTSLKERHQVRRKVWIDHHLPSLPSL